MPRRNVPDSDNVAAQYARLGKTMSSNQTSQVANPAARQAKQNVGRTKPKAKPKVKPGPLQGGGRGMGGGQGGLGARLKRKNARRAERGLDPLNMDQFQKQRIKTWERTTGKTAKTPRREPEARLGNKLESGPYKAGHPTLMSKAESESRQKKPADVLAETRQTKPKFTNKFQSAPGGSSPFNPTAGGLPDTPGNQPGSTVKPPPRQQPGAPPPRPQGPRGSIQPQRGLSGKTAAAAGVRLTQQVPQPEQQQAPQGQNMPQPEPQYPAISGPVAKFKPAVSEREAAPQPGPRWQQELASVNERRAAEGKPPMTMEEFQGHAENWQGNQQPGGDKPMPVLEGGNPRPYPNPRWPEMQEQYDRLSGLAGWNDFGAGALGQAYGPSQGPSVESAVPGSLGGYWRAPGDKPHSLYGQGDPIFQGGNFNPPPFMAQPTPIRNPNAMAPPPIQSPYPGPTRPMY